MAKENAQTEKLFLDPVFKDTKPLDEKGLDLTGGNEDSFASRCIAAQSFADYLTDADTDTENSTLPSSRRWVWYCKLPHCPGYYSAWTCKTNFLFHLYETPAHLNDAAIKTRAGRRSLANNWKEEKAFDLSEPKKQSPRNEETENGITRN